MDERLAQPAAVHHGAITLGGKSLGYQVHAAFVPVVASGFDGARGEPEAAVFTTAYLHKGAQAAQRPLSLAHPSPTIYYDRRPEISAHHPQRRRLAP